MRSKSTLSLKDAASFQMIVDHSFENIVFGTSLIGHSLFQDPNLLSDFESNTWLMTTIPPGEALQHILSRYKPGHMLVDEQGRYWVRRAKMCITRY